jgi:hypothetical protein
VRALLTTIPHGKLQRLIKPTLGFKSMKTAYATIKGFEGECSKKESLSHGSMGKASRVKSVSLPIIYLVFKSKLEI